MAGRIDQFTKARLVDAGQWQVFQGRRDELKAEGHSPDDARTIALTEALAQCDDQSDRPATDHAGGDLPVAPAPPAGRVCRLASRAIQHCLAPC